LLLAATTDLAATGLAATGLLFATTTLLLTTATALPFAATGLLGSFFKALAATGLAKTFGAETFLLTAIVLLPFALTAFEDFVEVFAGRGRLTSCLRVFLLDLVASFGEATERLLLAFVVRLLIFSSFDDIK
jgi:hypothetical protein